MIKTVIIEDEEANRKLLRNYLRDISNIEIVAEGSNVKEGIRAIKLKEPQLVLLDIELPDGTGFDVMESVDASRFKTIITTGYNKYAIRAIKLSAIDYLLKPIGKQELFEAIGNSTKIIQDEQYQHDLLQHYMKNSSKVDRLIISTEKYKRPVLFDEILYLKSDGGYTFFHLSNGESFISSRAIHYYEEFLPTDRFFRSHKSYIINFSFIQMIPMGRSGVIPMPNGKKALISVRRMAAFRKWYKENTHLELADTEPVRRSRH